MTYELSSAYTKVDPASYLSSGTNSFTCTSMPGNVAAEWYKSFGASYFGTNYYAEGQFVFTTSTASGTGINQAFVDISFSDTQTQAPLYVNALWLEFYSQASTTFIPRLNSYLGSVLGTSVPGTTLSVGTTYYYRLGFYTGIGQYGGFVIQVFSDAGLTTLVQSVTFFPAGAVPALRYFNPLASNNSTATKLATATNQNITLLTTSAGSTPCSGFTVSAGINPSGTLYTDAAHFILPNGTGAPNTLYAYKDYTAGYMSGNYTIQGMIDAVGISGASTVLQCSLFSVSNTLNGSNTTNNWQGIDVIAGTSPNYTLKIREVYGSTGYSSASSSTLTIHNPYWIKFWRDFAGNTINLSIYLDPLYSIQLGTTLTLTLHGAVNFQYVLLASTNNFSGTSTNGTFDLGSVSVTIPPPPVIVSTTPGAFKWAGVNTTLAAQAIAAKIGAWGFAGTPASLTQMIQSGRGTFTWAGKFSSVSTGNTMSTTIGAFKWAGKSSPLTINVTAKVGAWGWVGKTSILGATVNSLRTWEITKWDTATQKEIPVTGLTNVLYMLYDPITHFVFDFSDNTFKQSNLCTSPQGTMTERILLDHLGNNLTPGVYDILLSTTLLSGLYQEFGVYYGTNNYFNSNPVRFQDGIEYLGGLTTSENTHLTAIPTNPVLTTDARLNNLDAPVSGVPAAISAAEPNVNVEKIHGVQLTGDGKTTPMGAV